MGIIGKDRRGEWKKGKERRKIHSSMKTIKKWKKGSGGLRSRSLQVKFPTYEKEIKKC